MRAHGDHVELPLIGRLIRLPMGAFVAGNERDVTAWDGDVRAEHARNGPERLVEIDKAVAILQTPVTVEMFRESQVVVPVDAEVFSLPESKSIADRWERRPFWQVNSSPMAPVVGVTWDDARSFCQACSAVLGVRMRLPTEVEWECACRAGTTSLYFWGDDVRAGEEYSWFDGNSGMKVRPVRGRRPNPWGLFDMAGNVWEWCASSDDRVGLDDHPLRPVRGGSACHHATSGRSAHHFEQPRAQRNAFLGFRCVVELGS